jgi:hypothetical protein
MVSQWLSEYVPDDKPFHLEVLYFISNNNSVFVSDSARNVTYEDEVPCYCLHYLGTQKIIIHVVANIK